MLHSLKLRFHTICYKIRRASNGLPLPTLLLLWISVPSQTTFLVKGPGNFCSSLGGRLQFPASPWIYSNNPITSSHWSQEAPHTFNTINSASQSPSWFSGSMSGTSYAAPRGTQCPWMACGVLLPQAAIMWLINCSLITQRKGVNSWFYKEIKLSLFTKPPTTVRKRFSKEVRNKERSSCLNISADFLKTTACEHHTIWQTNWNGFRWEPQEKWALELCCANVIQKYCLLCEYMSWERKVIFRDSIPGKPGSLLTNLKQVMIKKRYSPKG